MVEAFEVRFRAKHYCFPLITVLWFILNLIKLEQQLSRREEWAGNAHNGDDGDDRGDDRDDDAERLQENKAESKRDAVVMTVRMVICLSAGEPQQLCKTCQLQSAEEHSIDPKSATIIL